MASPNQLPVRVTFGPFEVNTSTSELLKGGTRVRLPAQPFAILLLLLRTPGELVTREQLREQIWAEGTFVDFEHGLNAAMNKLRRALSDSADNPRYIETTPGRGYRFVGMPDSEHVVPISLLAGPEARQEHPRRRSVAIWERLLWTAGALGRPAGEPFAAWHFHGRASYGYCCQDGWSAAAGRIAVALKEDTGNIWLMSHPGRH